MSVDSHLCYNESAARRVNRIERIFVKLRHPDQCQFVALCNALDTQVETGIPHLPTVRLLAQAALTYAMSRGVDVDGTGLAQAAKKLLDYLESEFPERLTPTR
jgi:hypothetical protein